MIPVPSGVRVWLAAGVTDIRRGMNSLALQVQEGLGRDLHAGDLFVFRGRKGHPFRVVVDRLRAPASQRQHHVPGGVDLPDLRVSRKQ